MTLRKRLAIVALTITMAAATTVLTASPAHAMRDRSSCENWAWMADYSYRMWEWHLAFYGERNPVTLRWYEEYIGFGELYDTYC